MLTVPALGENFPASATVIETTRAEITNFSVVTGSPVDFHFTVSNLGNTNISVFPGITVYDSNNNTVVQLIDDTGVNMSVGSVEDVKLSWNASSYGNFTANLVVFYDNNSRSAATSEIFVVSPFAIIPPSGNVTLTIPFGTEFMDENGSSITNISIISINSISNLSMNETTALNASDEVVVGEAVDIEPEGTRFNPPIQIEHNYTLPLPGGISEDTLEINFFNKSTNTWDNLNSSINKTGHYVIANISHFTTFALIGQKATVKSRSGGGYSHAAVSTPTPTSAVTIIPATIPVQPTSQQQPEPATTSATASTGTGVASNGDRGSLYNQILGLFGFALRSGEGSPQISIIIGVLFGILIMKWKKIL